MVHYAIRSERQRQAQERNEELVRQYKLGLTEKENAVALGISASMAHRVKCYWADI